MGALAPISPWIPEDDLLLKNAVEAGASLESLAKGAVQFSRRFTVRELQERWHSLLYDPSVSEEAAGCMIEFERSVLVFPSKSSRLRTLKEKACIPGKRKAESVRSCYYALRKRTCNEPLNSIDLSFLDANNDNNYFQNVDELPSASCMLGDSITNHFEFEQETLGTMHHAFPQILMGDVADSNGRAYHNGVHNNGENDFPAEESSIQEENDLETKPPSSFDHINSNSGNICSGFGGKQVFNSPISDCSASLHSLGYTSPLAEMPIWRTIEGITAPDMPIDVSLAEKNDCRGDTLVLPDNGAAKDMSASKYNSGLLDFKSENQIPCDELKCSSTDGYLVELSNSLLDFSGDELIFLEADGKDVIDKSYYDGLSSLLLNYPSDVNQDNMANVTEPVIAPEAYLAIPDGACTGESNEKRSPHHVDGHTVDSSEVQMLSSTSSSKCQGPEYRDGVICCTLNTEDQEIPCNDDVVFPKQMPSSLLSAARKNFYEAAKNPFSKDRLDSAKPSENVLNLMSRERKNVGQSLISSSPELGVNQPSSGRGMQLKFPEGNTMSRTAGSTFGGLSQISSSNLPAYAVLPEKLKEECLEIELEKHLVYNSIDSFQEIPANGCDGFRNHSWTNASCNKQEIDLPTSIQNQEPHAELGSIDFAVEDAMANPSASDQEEHSFLSDDDIPCFSDIEAMILDMDLDPDDQDIYMSGELSRYQHEDTKRAIIRLEQGAHSYMERTIASCGAFAVLYGRHSKHYLKKPEVLLGRTTEDVIVDIDLGREGRANKISRRQAIIKMDDMGKFSVKNLGKCSMFVNNKEVPSGQSQGLNSGCLIEIRGMPFIFEMNETCVRDNMIRRSETRVEEVPWVVP